MRPATTCAGTAARMTEPITATPAAPAAMQAPALSAVTPPSASTGMETAATISASPSGSSAGP